MLEPGVEERGQGRGFAVNKMVSDSARLGGIAGGVGGGGLRENRKWEVVILENGERMDKGNDTTVPDG